MISLKRVYEAREDSDGQRVLVDRLWPRGLAKAVAGVDRWLKELAPSDELRRWFGHRPERWPEFRRRYLEELAAPELAEAVARLAALAREGRLTLLYGARDTEHNNAVVLKEFIESR